MLTQFLDLSTAAGVVWQFKPEGGDWGEISVPSGGYRRQAIQCDRGEYRTWIQIPRSAGGMFLRLVFEAVNFGCEILAGKDESSLHRCGGHIGGWMPVVADLTPLVSAGEVYLLVVRVRGRKTFQHEHLSRSWEWTGDFKTTTVKQWTIAEAAPWLEDLAEGIIRGVRLEILPPIHLDEPFITTSTAQGTLHGFVKVHNQTNEPVKGFIRQRLRSADDRQNDYPDLIDIPFTLDAADSRRFDLSASVWGNGVESYWWPNVPYVKDYRAVLHVLELEIVVDGKVRHRLSQRFGFREFTWKGDSFFLNGIKCNLRGDNQQEANFGTDAYGVHPGFGPPSRGNAGWPGAVATLLRLNFNVMRIHQVPPTPYMLDVCDELGLMIIDETPVRGSEGLEDWVGGWENMITAVREQVLSDRNHPSVIVWSAANEIWSNRPLSLALQGAVWSADWTRPVIIDGITDVGPEIINMSHYVGGLGVFPEQGGEKRSDRPYGETESIWPMDNALQGFAWMATSTRHRRLKGNADIRNYVLNNAFPNYVPGHGRQQQILEKKVKNIQWTHVTSGMEILPDIKSPWSNPNIILLQKCFNPCTACDVKYDQDNRLSNDKGEWPSTKPLLPRNELVRRMIAVFNDTFEGERLTLSWKTRVERKILVRGDLQLHVPLGHYLRVPIEFITPKAGREMQLELTVSKGQETIFHDDAIVFAIGEQEAK